MNSHGIKCALNFPYFSSRQKIPPGDQHVNRGSRKFLGWEKILGKACLIVQCTGFCAFIFSTTMTMLRHKSLRGTFFFWISGCAYWMKTFQRTILALLPERGGVGYRNLCVFKGNLSNYSSRLKTQTSTWGSTNNGGHLDTFNHNVLEVFKFFMVLAVSL